MRLNSDFHDYYDYAVGYGIDENVFFNRFTKDVEIHVNSKFDFPRHKDSGLIGFCGQIFPFIEVKKFDRKYDSEYASDDYKIVEYFHAYSLDEYRIKESEWEDFSDDFGYYDHWQNIKLKQFFTDWNFQSDEVFLEYKIPIWTLKLDESNGLINPKLKDFGFDRIKDSFTAFQEISMYLSNILVEQKEVAEIEDKFRIEQHGFDLKKSFRKEKKQ